MIIAAVLLILIGIGIIYWVNKPKKQKDMTPEQAWHDAIKNNRFIYPTFPQSKIKDSGSSGYGGSSRSDDFATGYMIGSDMHTPSTHHNSDHSSTDFSGGGGSFDGGGSSGSSDSGSSDFSSSSSD